MVVYLVRSFRTYARIRSLTTGTFNLVVKDRIAFRLSGAHPGLDGPAFFGRTQQERIRLSSKLYNHIVRVKPCQPAHPTAFPRVFHTRNLLWIGDSGSPCPTKSIVIPNRAERPVRNLLFVAAQKRATIWPSALDSQSTDNSAHAFRAIPQRKTEN